MISYQESVVIVKTPLWLAKSRRRLGHHLGRADPDGAVQPGLLEHGGLDPPRQRFGVVGRDADERLVPPEHLDHGAVVGPNERSTAMTPSDASV
jgi:hypothetical protein